MMNSIKYLMVAFALVSCSDQSGFSGDGGKSQESRPTPTATVVPTTNPEPTVKEPVVQQQSQQPVQPEQVIEGLEVYNNCNQCLIRAQNLSMSIGFTADMSRTVNMGIYKVNPALNLCDIHFMADMNLPISDHSGVDSMGFNQIILYCPCNCGWAVDGSTFAPGGPGFPPFF